MHEQTSEGFLHDAFRVVAPDRTDSAIASIVKQKRRQLFSTVPAPRVYPEQLKYRRLVLLDSYVLWLAIVLSHGLVLC